MKSLKTESSSIGDLFALSRAEQSVAESGNINWWQVALTVGTIALLLLLLYFAIKADMKRHADSIMPGPKRPVEVSPVNSVDKAQSATASESPVVQEKISGPDKKEV